MRYISVIVPVNPFAPKAVGDSSHCLTAIDVMHLMEWWPGKPHAPHRNPAKVRAIQRSLDWKRVVHIAAYLLQREIVDAPVKVRKYFEPIYGAAMSEPGRQWPPRVPSVVGYERSRYPTFSNVLLHVNGAKLEAIDGERKGAARLVFDESDKDLNFSVIDGQHRINGAYLAVSILAEDKPDTRWEIPAEIFLDLDKKGEPPRHQAQIFIDVNFNQKKVDRSLVADLFPTARGRTPFDDKERAQDLGRRLMLEQGPLMQMIQIPGIRFGTKDVITLATLNGAIEDALPTMRRAGIETLASQASYLSLCIEAWLEATGRKETQKELSAENVVYQGRVLVAFLSLLPACIVRCPPDDSESPEAVREKLARWLTQVLKRAGLLEQGKFLSRTAFKRKGFLGSGGIARFRDLLWAAAGGTKSVAKLKPEKVTGMAATHRARILSEVHHPTA